MSCQDKVELKLDPVYRQLIMDLTIGYLSDEPPNFVEYGCNFFQKKLRERSTEKTPEITVSDESEDEDYYRSRRCSVRGESFNPEEIMDQDDEFTANKYPKTDSQRALLEKTVRKILFLKFLDDKDRDHTVNAMFRKSILRNDVVIKEGDFGDFFYIIEKGIFEAYKETNGKPEVLKYYDNEGYFGELALLYNTPRAVSIRAKTDGALWALDRKTFRKLLLKSEFKRTKEYVHFLESVPILKSLSSEERLNLADCLSSKFYKPGQRIIAEGEVGDGMYFIISGTARITVRVSAGNKEKELKTLSPGEYFGELALITNNPRAASVYAVDDVHVAFLPLDSFERLLGPCIEIMKRNIQDYDEQLQQVCLKSFSFQREG